MARTNLSTYKFWNRPSVVVLEEKHCDRYFPAATEEEFFRSALFILNEREESGYYQPSYGERPKQDITLDQVVNLPDDNIVKKLYLAQEDDIRRYDSYVKNWDNWVNLKNKALQNNDGYFAWMALLDRSDFEYEEVSLQPLVMPW